MTINRKVLVELARYFPGEDGTENLESFDAIGIITHHGDVAVCEGFKGTAKLKYVIETYKSLRSTGSRWLIAHRKEGHRLPLSSQIPEGQPFAGWWAVDLNEI